MFKERASEFLPQVHQEAHGRSASHPCLHTDFSGRGTHGPHFVKVSFNLKKTSEKTTEKGSVKANPI
jgi:hypothetical protein